MTKSEVRAISLDKLGLAGKKTMLDVGAGTGSVSIQAAHDYPDLKVTAIERNPSGIDIIRQNIQKFHLENIDLIEGLAPADLPEQSYDAIFVGGSGGELAPIIDFAAKHLNDSGQIVLNFILYENAMQVSQLLKESGFQRVEMVEVTVMRWHRLGPGHFFKPNNPTIIVSAQRKD